MNKNKMLKLKILHKIILIFLFITFIPILTIQEMVSLNSYILYFYGSFALYIIVTIFFIDKIIDPTKDEKHYEYHKYIYDIVAFFIVTIVGIIVILQYPFVYKALFDIK